MGRRKTNEEFQEEVYEKNEYVICGDIEILGEYVDCYTKIKCRCVKHDYIWDISSSSLLQNRGCPKCGVEKAINSQRMSKEEFVQKVTNCNEYIGNGQIEMLESYTSMKTPIKCICHKHNCIFYQTPERLCQGRGCKKCGNENKSKARSKLHDEFVEEVSELNKGYVVIGTYIDSKTQVEILCPNGHIWFAVPTDILGGCNCPYCSGHKAYIGETTLWDLRPDVASLLEDMQIGYRYGPGSHAVVNFVCPYCKTVHAQRIRRVCEVGIACPVCSDGVSYPGKFGRALLRQLNVNNVQYEYSPSWLKPYAYDNYFEYMGKFYCLETDGGLGHGNKKFKSKEKDVDGKARDDLKDSLARKHGISVIRIDCDYGNSNRFEYIKQSIINSELSILFDLSHIDWKLCDLQSQKTLVKQAADLYNDGRCVQEICNILGYCIGTVWSWLRTASQYGMCDYNRKDSTKRSRRFSGRRINQYSTDGVFICTYLSGADAHEKTGVHSSSIHSCCKSLQHNKTAGGFFWFYADDPNQPDKTKIILTTQN